MKMLVFRPFANVLVSMKLAKAVIILGMIIPDTGLKTDPVDARRIANILCAGMIPVLCGVPDAA